MNLDTARKYIRSSLERMDELYRKTVFDEWVIISLVKKRAAILHYEGPRAESFANRLQDDAANLSATMEGRRYEIGDFEFVQDASGASFDAAVRLGQSAFLLCNNTKCSMAELRADPTWREAQKPFLALTHKFLASPLDIEAP